MNSFSLTHLDGVLEVPLDLIEHVLGATTQQHGAGLGVRALLQEGEVPASQRVQGGHQREYRVAHGP